MQIIFLIVIALLLLIAIILIIVFRTKSGYEIPQLQNKIAELQTSLSEIKLGLKEDFRINREENSGIAKDNRIELNNSLKDIGKTFEDKVDALISKIEENNKSNREELTKNITNFSAANILQLEKINNQAKEDNRLIREALVNAFHGFQETFDNNICL